MPPVHITKPLFGVVVLLAAICGCPSLRAQITAPAQDAAAKPQLRFSFTRAPWQDVLEWLAKSANLSLHIAQLPVGSFTYSDPRSYTPAEAIDRLNLFLIPQRHSLVRTNQLLSVISLDDDLSLRQLDALAPFVTPEELPHRNPGEIVKCLFPLHSAPLDQTLQELTSLMLIREPALLRTANQILVTDTAAKLQTVQQILGRLASSADPAGNVRVYNLGHLDPERTLAQIRPHVGLEPLAMTGAGISFSLDAGARRLYASGSPEKLQALNGVMILIRDGAPTAQDNLSLTFRTHSLAGAESQTVVSVLQTLLADEDVRLAPDAASNQIAVLASDDIHTLVAKTISQLAPSDALEFRAIPLGASDLRQTLAQLHAIFGVTSSDKPNSSAVPRIDADPATNRLLIRAKASQIAEIERVLAQLHPAPSTGDERIRLLPFSGDRGRKILELAERFWPDPDHLLVFPPSSQGTEELSIEREINPASHRPPVSPPVETPAARPSPRTAASPETVRAQLTPQGILIQSADLESLNQFERHLRLIASSESAPTFRLAVYYLKHSTAVDADRLLRRLLAAESTTSGINAPVADGAQPSSSSNAWAFRSATIIADSRLNRVFVYGSSSDLAEIERHLAIVDREASLANVRTHGAPRVVQLQHAKAADIAAVIRDAYAGRIAATNSERREAAVLAQRPQPGASPGRGDPTAAAAALLATPTDASDQPRLTLATDAENNCLIVTAPLQLANEVERLALQLDRQTQQQNEQTAEVVRVVSSRDAKYVHTTLKRLLDQATTDSEPAAASPSPSRSPPPTVRPPSPSPTSKKTR